MHHAFVIEAETEKGIEAAQAWAHKEFGMKGESNPDIVTLRYGLLSVEDARGVADRVAGAPFAGEHKVVIIAASRVYHEAQNALLKLFEEPPQGTHLFLILPSLGGLLPTLRSRVQVLEHTPAKTLSDTAEQFLKVNKERRALLIKKLTTGKDEEERRAKREEAITLINGIEAVAYAAKGQVGSVTGLLSDIATLRSHLYDRSAPVKLILEHLSLVIPRNLL